MTQPISCIECYKKRPGGRCRFCPLHPANKDEYIALGDGTFISKSETDKKETNKHD